MSYKRVGGLRFVRIGRVQLSWCITKRKPSRPAPELYAIDAMIVACGIASLFAIV